MASTGCGGGGDDASDETFTFDTGIETLETTGESAVLDPASVPAPGQARVEVDGNVHVLRASGSVYFTCEVGAERITVNFQETDSGSLSIQGGVLDGEWSGNVTFAPTGLDNYGGGINGGEVAVGEDALTFTGTLAYRSLSDPTNTRDAEASIAVNCDTGGAGEAMAEIDGETFTFPASGAQSYDCEVTASSARVLVNRLALEDSQIQIDASQQDGRWLGGVYVVSGEDRYNGILPADGSGLEISGSTLTFTGTFTRRSETDPALEQEVVGTASVTC